MSDPPTTGEVRRYLQGLDWNLSDTGGLPRVAYEKWNEDHPERPYPLKRRTFIEETWDVRVQRAVRHRRGEG